MEVDSHYLPDLPAVRPAVIPVQLNFTPDDIQNYAIYFDLKRSESTRTKARNAIEMNLLRQARCSVVNPELSREMKAKLFEVDDLKLDRYETEHVNSDVDLELACMVDTINAAPINNFPPSRRERFRHWFTSLSQIGSPSVEGYAVLSSFSRDTKLFVIKTPRDPSDDNLVHEALVGTFMARQCRLYVPNFMYVYGYTRCSPPVILQRQVVSQCTASDPAVGYLITENIRDSIPIREFVRVCDGATFMKVFVSLLNGLNVAFALFEYTHYDLHDGNVMIREFKQEVSIPIYNEHLEVTGFLKSRYVPYIIDYGNSHIKVGDRHFGKIGLEVVGIGYTPNPMYDVYKLLGFLGESVYTASINLPNIGNVRTVLEGLWTFFGEGPLSARVDARLNNGRDWYNTSTLYTATYYTFLDWIQQGSLAVPLVTEISTLTIVPMQEAITSKSFFEMFSTGAGPADALEYCDAYVHVSTDPSLNEQDRREAINWLNRNFDSGTSFDETYPKVIQRIQTIQDIVNNRALNTEGDLIPVYTTLPVDANLITAYRNGLVQLAIIKENSRQIETFIRCNNQALHEQQKLTPERRAQLQTLLEKNARVTRYLERQRQLDNQNAKLIKRTNNDVANAFWLGEYPGLKIAI